MSVEYQFPCECGHLNRISVSDAGNTISCKGCDAQLEIPGMREIKKLKPFGEPTAEKDSKSAWTYEKGVWFSFGTAAFCLGLVVAGICLYVGYYNYPHERPKVRGDWYETATNDPPVDIPVWAYAPEPTKDGQSYEFTMFDYDKNMWIFESPDLEPVPPEYFTKWGDSYQTAIESTAYRSSLEDLWKFWHETEPQTPLKEWAEPAYSINARFAYTYYAFAGLGGLVTLIGLGMVIFAVGKK